MQTTLPPARSEPKSAATSPWMWKSGITFRHRSVGSSRSVSATFAADVSRLRSVSGTSFGEPVVPEVNNSRAASVSPAPRDAPSPSDRPEQAIDPAVSPASSSITGIPHATAARRAAVAWPRSTMTARTPSVVSWCENSDSGRSGARGAHTAAATVPSTAAAASGPFGRATATRSVGAIPPDAQVAPDPLELVDQGVERHPLSPRRQQRDRGRRAA